MIKVMEQGSPSKKIDHSECIHFWCLPLLLVKINQPELGRRRRMISIRGLTLYDGEYWYIVHTMPDIFSKTLVFSTVIA